MGNQQISFRLESDLIQRLQRLGNASESPSAIVKALILDILSKHDVSSDVREDKDDVSTDDTNDVSVISAPITPTPDVLRGFVDAAIASAIAPLEARLEQLEALISETPTPTVGTTDNSGTLNQVELARRLDVSAGLISQNKKAKTPLEFAEWTKARDPDKQPWCYNRSIKLFQVVTNAQQLLDATLADSI